VAKIPLGVGPKHPQVVVLFGATGSLSRRKLFPGLFHLSSSGFIPGCRIIGVSLEEFTPDAFREFGREALQEFSSRKVIEAAWDVFATNLDTFRSLLAQARSRRQWTRPRSLSEALRPADCTT